jgi:hypothetical protein
MKRVVPVLKEFVPLQQWSLLAGVIAAVLCAVAAFFRPDQFFAAYLIAFLLCWTISMGCLAISLLHHLTGGGWGIPIRRTLEAASSTLPLLALMVIPILFNLPRLYIWARPEVLEVDAILRQKLPYLNPLFFQLRAVFYFAVWIVLNAFVNWAESTVTRKNESERRQTLAKLGAAGIVLWGLTVTFAAIDWSMSLDPHWISQVYGVLFMSGQAVSGMAFVIVVVINLRRDSRVASLLTISRLHDVGNFLMAFTLFWTYITLTQFLVIWSGNLPEETPWYLIRSTGGWQYVITAIICLHFVLPFLILLCRSTKRNPYRLQAVACLLLAMRVVDLYWLVQPAFSPGVFAFNWMLFLTIPAVGGIWLAVFIRNLTFRLALPIIESHSETEEGHERIEPAVS